MTLCHLSHRHEPIDPDTGQCDCCGEIVSGDACETCRDCDGLSLRSRYEHHELHAGPGDGPRYDRDELASKE